MTEPGHAEQLRLSHQEHEKVRMNTQAQLLAKQVQTSPYYVLIIVAVLGYLVFPDAEKMLVIAWFIFVTVSLMCRLLYARKVSAQAEQSDAAQALKYLTWFAFLNGLAVGISVPLFFAEIDIETRAIIALILVGLSAGGIATSAAYPPVFTAYILPALLPLAASWLLMGNKYILIGLLVLAFIFILLKYVRKNQELLRESISIRFEREQLVRQLEAKQTELMVAMEQTQHAREKAEAAGLAKARVLAAASHDLRQPLHALSLYSAVLSQRPEPEVMDEVSNQIDQSVRALSALLNALLDISKLDAGVYQIEVCSFSISDVLGRIVQEFQAVAEQKNLMLYLDCRPLYTYSDPVVFEQIARNLIDNAIKYTDSGAVLVSATLEGEQIYISVHDTGKGIPAMEIERIFEEFYQLNNPSRNRQQGLGLGLSIVNRLAELVKSRIRVTSVHGEGSCFSWHIPLERRGSVADARAGNNQEEVYAMNSRVQVLVIEDEAAIRHGMALLLGTWGMEAHGCATQDEAEQILSNREIDIIIADLRLHDGVRGLDIVNALREQRKTLPVLLISGETEPEKLRDVAKSGFSLMNKPIQPEMLRKHLAQLLERH